MLTTPGIAIRFTSRTFFVLDSVGLHVSFRGHEVAWTREFGWVAPPRKGYAVRGSEGDYSAPPEKSHSRD